MSDTVRVPRARRDELDPDALAILEEERDFLLRSLADLEREHAAGDVDDTDFAALKDDYTARAAAVLRSIEQRRTALASAAPPRSVGRRVAWVAVVVLVAGLAGLLIARSSGSRRDGDTATGDTQQDTRELLSEAQQAAVDGKYDESIKLYTDALAKQPGNTEALTYRGWSKQRKGDTAGAAADLDAAIDLDASYPDARVFRAVVFAALKQWDAAAEQLRVFGTLDAPPLMEQIITSQRLREKVALGRVEPKLLVAAPPTLAASGFTADEVFLAAQQLDLDGRAKDELALYTVLLAADPKDLRAIAYSGWVLARSGVQQKQQTLVDAAMKQFDTAVALDATYPDVRVFRAFTYQFGLSRPAEAKAELAAFDALPQKPAALVALIDDNNLRSAIESSLAGK
jgi:tetratricopeptide (TPR) repeat protein